MQAHHEITPREKSGRGPGLGDIPKMWGSPLIFLQRLKVATSRLARKWASPRPITISDPEKKWAWLWARELPKILGFPFNISATAEARDFKFCMLLGFAKAQHKITRRRKVGVAQV